MDRSAKYFGDIAFQVSPRLGVPISLYQAGSQALHKVKNLCAQVGHLRQSCGARAYCGARAIHQLCTNDNYRLNVSKVLEQRFGVNLTVCCP